MLIPRRNSLEILALFFLSLLLFTWGVQGQEIIAFDTRFYLFAQEMYRHGATWFPTALQRPYPDYPGTSTWVIYVFALLMGGVQKLTAVLPTAIMASVTTVLTFLIGSLRHKHWGWCAVACLLLTIAFFKSARSISLDMYSTVISAACFYLLSSAGPMQRPWRTHWVYPLLVLGFMFRGPIGLVVPAGVVIVYYLLDGKIKKFILTGLIASLLLLACTLVLIALAYHAGGNDFMQQVLRMQILGRIDNPYLPRHFYFTNSFASYALSYPIAILVMLGIFYYAAVNRPSDGQSNEQSANRQFIFKLFAWMMVILLGMTVPDDKKVRYILPIAPAAALIAAYPFVASASQRYFVILRKIFMAFFCFLPFALLIAAVFVVSKVQGRHWPIVMYPMYLYGFYVLMQIINISAMYPIFMRHIQLKVRIVLMTAVVSFAVSMITLIEPIALYIDRARDFVTMIETKRIKDHAQLIFYKGPPDGLPLKYMIHQIGEDKPVFMSSPPELMQVTGPTYFIASENDFIELPETMAAHFTVIAKDNLGHVPVVAFKRKNGR